VTVPLALVVKLTDIDPATRRPEGVPFAIGLTGPNNTRLLDPPVAGVLQNVLVPKLKTPNVPDSFRVILNLGGVVLPEPGVYSAELTLGSGDHPVPVMLTLTAEQFSA
jgi:hypothetical protein